jgi:GntR family transcriptional repressor for pyruvate dehydrogenase complex
MSPLALRESLHVAMQRAEASMLHLAEVRWTLESQIAELAAERMTGEMLVRLRQSIDDLRQAPDVAAQVDADMRFHRILAEAGGNPIFVFLLDALAELLRVSRQKTIGLGGVEPALRGHRAILAAVERGDAAAAREAMQEHLAASLRDLATDAAGGAA